MLLKNIKKTWLTIFLTFVLGLSLTLISAPSSNARGGCEFGYYEDYYDEYDEVVCEKSSWDIEKNDDGFDKLVIGSMTADNTDISNSSYDFSLHVRCTTKKLEVFGITQAELFFKSAYTSGGPVQVKFDSGKVVNYKFTKSTSNRGFFLNNPKTFATALTKAKNKVALKFSSSLGIVVLQFPIGDFVQNKKAYTSAGCKF